MPQEGSVAPQERVNIVYKTATGGVESEVELPLKLLVMGDFTNRPDSRPLEDRKPVNVDKDNFDDVLRNQGITLSLNVPNRLSEKQGEETSVTLKIDSIKDFEPDSVARQVPGLRKLLELREALTALKGPLGNIPAFRQKIQKIMADPEARERILKEIEKAGS